MITGIICKTECCTFVLSELLYISIMEALLKHRMLPTINHAVGPLESFVGEMRMSLKLRAREALVCAELL